MNKKYLLFIVLIITAVGVVGITAKLTQVEPSALLAGITGATIDPPGYSRFVTIQGAESVNPPIIANFDRSDPTLEFGVISGSGDLYFEDSNLYITKPNNIWWQNVINLNRQGWPISAGNVDGDTLQPDILATSPAGDHKLFAFQPNGGLIGGSPLLGYSCFSTAISDIVLDNQNANEVICAGGSGAGPGIRTIRRQNGQWQALWTFGLNYGPAISDPAIGDTDKDGKKEIAFFAFNSSTNSYSFFLIKGENGQPKEGWPVPSPTPGFQFYFGAKPAIADIYGDSNKEIVFIADNSFIMQPGQEEGIVVLNHRGAMNTHVIDGLADQETVIANIDQSDRQPEILFQEQTSAGGSLHVFKFNGQSFTDAPGWPQPFSVGPGGYAGFSGPIVVGDIDNDGQSEIVLATFSNDLSDVLIYAWNLNGTNVPGYPLRIPTGQPNPLPNDGVGTGMRFLVLADSDADGQTEITLQTSQKFDLDQNGSYDDAEIYLTTIETNGSPKVTEWPMFGHDNERTRSYAP